MRARLRRVIARQIERRSPSGVPPIRVSPRRLYILPTRFGGVFVLLMVGLLVGATNYGNNLAFALAFWLGAIALVSMHRAHRNLAGLTLVAIHTPGCHAGEALDVRLVWASRARRVRRSVAVGLGNGPTRTLDIGENQSVILSMPAECRGPQRVPSVCLESRYPLGLFRCWARLAPDHVAWIYPRLAPYSVSHDAGATPGGDPVSSSARPTGPASDDFVSHRRYRDGDALTHIDWKHSARYDYWLVREFEPPRQAPQAVFDYHALSGLAHETRLSRLARQVVHAARTGTTFRLVLPNGPIGPSHGAAHRRACLDALARLP
ncbi:DUF58 domain-containing protein [uncultured Salinisphaera sp.]|uniref:DUF58 domain-containing protein n=1 Tax=uncultured Salinisphaera sp. TaxID=359372 RepID=UPI0032B2F002|tara:strand:+ start:1078 stop:2037 length:960 start_codon:yes stop_codon:yes gene_type:complete